MQFHHQPYVKILKRKLKLRRKVILNSLALLIVLFFCLGRDQNELFNLMEESDNPFEHFKECSLEYINANRLQQDHPCVLDLIRRRFMNRPAPPDATLRLKFQKKKDVSADQVLVNILPIIQNTTEGFFIESGATNDEKISNTLFLERYRKWTGILIEPEPESFEILIGQNRKAWAVPSCLSLEKYPTEASFEKKDGKILGAPSVDDQAVNVQCFPFYSILLAHGKRRVDLFSLDVEGHQLQILRTIPWHKVDITVIAVQYVQEGYKALDDFMKKQGYVSYGNIATSHTRDGIFVRDILW